MPSLGADMEKGTVALWTVKPGEAVKRGDVIVVIGTDKGSIDVEAFDDGVVEDILVPVGAEVPVGTVLAHIRTAVPVAAAGPASPPPVGVPPPPPLPPVPTPPPAGERQRISPLARKLAADLHVDVAFVHGSGPRGEITRADVEKAAKPVEQPLPARPADAAAGMRRAIALAMARANREIPHYYLETRIDMSNALRWLDEANARRDVTTHLLPVVLLVRGVVQALAQVPELNGWWKDDRADVQPDVNLGFAVSVRGGGLITPALMKAQALSLDQIMAGITDLITRTRGGHLRSSEMTQQTITVTSLGDLGVETVYGVIYPPQLALVGFGRILDEPWAEHGMVGSRPVVHATLAGDHRATDGRHGARFLDALNRLLQEPEKL